MTLRWEFLVAYVLILLYYFGVNYVYMNYVEGDGRKDDDNAALILLAFFLMVSSAWSTY